MGTSGTFDIEVADTETVSDLLKKGMEKHKIPKWADGVELKGEKGDDLAEDASATIGSLSLGAGATLTMSYYQDVLPSEAKKLKFMGIEPGTACPFLAPK